MLVTFSSQATASFIMLPAHAQTVLRAAGKSFMTLPAAGVFTAAQLPAAIAALEAAIQSEPPEPEPDLDAPKPHPVDEPVSLARRAYPLLDMLRRARKKGREVVWEVGE